MAAFKRPGELSASAFGLSFADRDAGSAAPAPIYNKNERLALADQVRWAAWASDTLWHSSAHRVAVTLGV